MRNKRNLWLLLVVLVSEPAFSQHNFTVQELIDIYLADKETAIKCIEEKGYMIAGSDEIRQMFGQTTSDNFRVLSANHTSSKLGIIFSKNRIGTLIYTDSVKLVNHLLDELRKRGLDLVNKLEDGMSEVYTEKKMNYFLWYEEVIDESTNRAVIWIQSKGKHNKLLYDPKR
jgi:endo-1,4-beta-mannosidase